MNNPDRHNYKGFTLTELIIAVAILSVMVAASLPSFQQMIAEQRLRSAADAMVSSVLFARSEAIKRGTQITIRKETDGWSKGWIVKTAAGVELRREALDGVVATQLNVDEFTFGRDGRVGDTLTMSLCDTYNLATIRVVTISFSGMARVAQGVRCGS